MSEETGFVRIILNVCRDGAALGSRAACYLIDNPEKADALLEYGEGNDPPRYWVRRAKSSIVVWQQPNQPLAGNVEE